MNPDLCFEYQQLMLRYNEKNKALNVQQKNTEMRSKNMKQRLDHEEKINKVFENAKSAEKSAEKVETRNTNNGKDKKVNSITENTKSFENKKSLFPYFLSLSILPITPLYPKRSFVWSPILVCISKGLFRLNNSLSVTQIITDKKHW